MKRKMFTVLVIMVIILVPLYAQNEDDFEIKQNADNTLTITGYKGTIRGVVIPSTLYGLPVTVIGSRAFREKGLTSMVISDTITIIQDSAFSRNDKLSKVTLGNNLISIGDNAFYGCTQLSEIIVPNSVTSIGDSAFLCSITDVLGRVHTRGILTKVTFGTGLQTIDASAFKGNRIVELEFPSSLRLIGDAAFEDNNIQKITFSKSLQTIGNSAFNKNQITELNLPSPLTTIGGYAFRDNKITELNLPSSLRTIGAGAFANNLLQSVNIPNGVTSIKTWYAMTWTGAFTGNPLEKVIIPASLAKGEIESGGHGTPIFGKINGSSISSITVPAGMDENILKNCFEESFINFWISQNKVGGTYIKRGPIWSKE